MLCAAQTKPGADITSVATSGTVSGNRYVNSFFGVTIEAPEATFQLNPLLNSGGQRARLLQVLSKRGDWADTFTLAVLADSLRNYPTLQSPERYVRSVRHQLEREGLSTVREDFPITISGVQFAGVVVQEQAASGRKYYRGTFATFRQGYVLSLDVEAASPEQLNVLVSRLVTFGK
jgi:hypothetical protein